MSNNELNQEINSRPQTISKHINYLRDFIYQAGYNEDTRCRDLILGRNNEKLPNYLIKVGDFNFKESSAPTWNPEQRTVYPDYSAKCPLGWKETGDDCIAPSNYEGPCPTGRIGNCPEGSTKSADNCAICNFVDSNCNDPCMVKRCVGANGSYSNKKCYLRRQDIPNFKNFSDADKARWELRCNVKWPEKVNTVAANWSCNYGDSLNQDSDVVNIGRASNYFEAALLVLSDRNPYKNTLFFAIIMFMLQKMETVMNLHQKEFFRRSVANLIQKLSYLDLVMNL